MRRLIDSNANVDEITAHRKYPCIAWDYRASVEEREVKLE
jgi:hypothetical protein